MKLSNQTEKLKLTIWNNLKKRGNLIKEIMKIVIPLDPKTKKNHQEIMFNKATGRRYVAQSEYYKEYEASCGYFLKIPEKAIDYPVNVKAIYYMKTRRRVDMLNLLAATCDILVKYNILLDDNFKIVYAHDGSRIKYDKENPRAEITISKIDLEAELDEYSIFEINLKKEEKKWKNY